MKLPEAFNQQLKETAPFAVVIFAFWVGGKGFIGVQHSIIIITIIMFAYRDLEGINNSQERQLAKPFTFMTLYMILIAAAHTGMSQKINSIKDLCAPYRQYETTHCGRILNEIIYSEDETPNYDY